MKLLGAILIVISFTLIGFAFSNKLKSKYTISRELVLFAELLKIKINNNLDEISVIFESLSNYDSLKDLTFLNQISVISDSFFSSFTKAVENSKLPLRSADVDLLYNLGENLGTTDWEGQNCIISSFISEMTKSCNFYLEEYKRLGKLYLSFGFFGGLVITIIFL